jgi:hypothetical protein
MFVGYGAMSGVLLYRGKESIVDVALWRGANLEPRSGFGGEGSFLK